ncbi:MAG: hypothetical protein GEU91_07175 [Rhizobiales bacterium]|nr:hypothetical protein [Hyphomicrobiales bacterium]
MNATSHEPGGAPAEPTESPEWAPKEIAAHRRYCTWLQYWRDCAAPACRRAHACAADPTDCFIRRWMHLSDAAKIWVGAGIKTIDHGLTARNAAGAADLALLRHVKTADRLPSHPPRHRRRQWIEGEGDAETTRAGSAGSGR